MAGTCTGPGPCDTTSFGAGRNWVNKVGGLPDYVKAVAHAFRRQGLSESEAISRAIGVIRNWAEGKGNVTAATRARAAKALAEWEAKKAASHALSVRQGASIDLATKPGQRYRHGWIPLVPKTETGQRIYERGGVPHVERTLTAGELQPGDRIGAGSSRTLSPPIASVTAKDGVVYLKYEGRGVVAHYAHKRLKVLRPHRGKVVSPGKPGLSLSTGQRPAVDLAAPGHVYHWRHGWIPITPHAALQKAHGSHAGAARILGANGQHHDAQRQLLHGLAASKPGSSQRTRYRRALASHMSQHGTLVGPNGKERPSHPDGPSLHVEHTGDGTLVHGTSRNDGTAPILKQHGFRYSSNLGAWYLPRNQTESTRRMKADQVHSALANAGHPARLTKEASTATSAAQRERVARQRATDRAERMTARAEGQRQVADAQRARSDSISGNIPFGQPVLVGHHSQRRHERDLTRMRSAMDKSAEASQAAKDADAAAARARQAAAGDSPLARIRRAERNAADLRKIDRSLKEHEIALKAPEAAARVGIRPMAPEHHAQLSAERARLQDQIAHDRAQVEQSGHVGIQASDITPGDVIHYRGRPHMVTKVNKTTVSVPSGYSWDDKVPLSQITKHIRTESTARLEDMLNDPQLTVATKDAVRRVLAARVAKKSKARAS